MLIEFKWGTSRARDTYGYTVCKCLVNNQPKGKTCGGGYDLKGTAFANAMMETFPAELLALADRAHSKYRVTKDKEYQRLDATGSNLLYGMTAYYDEAGAPLRVSLDGACGFQSMENIMDAAGYKLKFIKEDLYELVKKT